ncbi:hypothetical protein [Klebsiella pneumoniae]|uniref:hypothetical protein n=1 Tax=Klebsiella pneumoniae TaxID=573 RepID=UPI001E4DB7B0|nr:hypothetical protein [Klebsiella pneumoniae]
MINGAILGAEKGHEFVFSIYEEVKKSLRTNFIPIPRIITYIYQKIQTLKILRFSKRSFYPFNPYASPIKQLLYKDIQKKTLWLYITGVSHGTHRLFKNAIED